MGRNLRKDKLIDFILGTRKYSEKLPLRSRNTVSKEEEKEIEISLPPPDDFIFDGTFYIDFEGRRIQ